MIYKYVLTHHSFSTLLISIVGIQCRPSQVRLTLTPGYFKYSRKLKCHDANRSASFIRQIYCIKYFAHDMLISLTQLSGRQHCTLLLVFPIDNSDVNPTAFFLLSLFEKNDVKTCVSEQWY